MVWRKPSSSEKTLLVTTTLLILRIISSTEIAARCCNRQKPKKGCDCLYYQVKIRTLWCGEFDADIQTPYLYREERNIQSTLRWQVCYDNDVVEIAKNIKPSPRGGLKSPNINKAYLERGDLSEAHGPVAGYGTHESLLQATQYIETVQRLQEMSSS